jgi:hypothetical protein
MPNLARQILDRMAAYPEYTAILDTPGLAFWFNQLTVVAIDDRKTLDALLDDPSAFDKVIALHKERAADLEAKLIDQGLLHS